jgi:hypothetical protein
MSPSTALFRFYRPIILWFAAILVAVEVIAVTAICLSVELRFSFWLIVAGSAAKYWVLVVGIMLVAMNLRQFVSNGVTRHEFLRGVATFMAAVAIGFAVVVVAGHGLESLVVGAAGSRDPAYPVLTAGEALGEFGRVLPQALAWGVSGLLIAVGFYRFKAWIGLVVMVLGAVPAGVAGSLLSIPETGIGAAPVPYPAALALSLLATGLAAAAFQRVMSDVPIRRTAG